MIMLKRSEKIEDEETFIHNAVDIINPAHIVNVMSNDMESPRVEVEFVNRASTIEFDTHNEREQFLEMLMLGASGTMGYKQLSNHKSRWV